MKNLILILLILLYFNISAQNTFNHRINFDAPAAVITNILPTDSCYYVSGVIADSLPPFNAGNVFARIDLEGNEIWYKKLVSPNKTFQSWDNTLKKISDNEFIISGWTTFVDTTAVFYMKYDEIGDTSNYHHYFHPDSATATIIHRDFQPLSNGEFIFLGSIRLETHADFYAIKINDDGEIIWGYAFGDDKWDLPYTILANNSTNQIILGGLKTNQNFVNENYQFQTHLFALDSLGNELWTYLSPISEGLRDGARDMILLDDGSLIVASGIGYEQERPSVNVVWFEKSVFRLNANQEKEWEVSFPEDSLTSRARTTNLINTSDNSGFIVAGLDVVSDWEVTFQQMGWLAKLSYDGDSIWTRRYQYLDTDKSDHEFFDLKETPDGGFILCGESRDREDNAIIPQQAWLLKLDQHGCLIPGCHLIDDVRETERSSYELKLYPNPTSDYLNVFVRHHRGQRDFTFRIKNGIGQELAVFEQRIQEETLMIDLVGYASGIYYLEVMQNGESLETEKFIVN
jgi:hypothetical protein